MRTQPKDGRQREKWSDDKLELLERLWREGETAATIADQLGFSRGAVVGKVFRLRLAGASKPQARRPGRKYAPPAPPPATPQKKLGKSLLELTNGDCRWPIGNPGSKQFHFCGEPGADVEQGIPYCRLHMQRAYVPAAPKPGQASSGIGGWHAVSPAISAAVWRMFRAALARKERT